MVQQRRRRRREEWQGEEVLLQEEREGGLGGVVGCREGRRGLRGVLVVVWREGGEGIRLAVRGSGEEIRCG